jgi:hypothetical protein
MAVMAVMAVMAGVPKVHERARQEQQIRQSPEYVRAVVDHKSKPRQCYEAEGGRPRAAVLKPSWHVLLLIGRSQQSGRLSP